MTCQTNLTSTYGHMYIGEGLMMLGRVSEAIEHLAPKYYNDIDASTQSGSDSHDFLPLLPPPLS